MAKIFNVSGTCEPGRHYMVALKPRLKEIRAMIDAVEYFTMNKNHDFACTDRFSEKRLYRCQHGFPEDRGFQV